jgi:hypothetical protein
MQPQDLMEKIKGLPQERVADVEDFVEWRGVNIVPIE